LCWTVGFIAVAPILFAGHAPTPGPCNLTGASQDQDDYAFWLSKQSWKSRQEERGKYKYVLKKVWINPYEPKPPPNEPEKPRVEKPKPEATKTAPGKPEKPGVEKPKPPETNAKAERQDLLEKRKILQPAQPLKGEWKDGGGKVEGEWELSKRYELKEGKVRTESEAQTRGEFTTIEAEYRFVSTRKRVGGLWEKVFGEKSDTVHLTITMDYPSEFFWEAPMEVKGKATLEYDVGGKGAPCLLIWAPPPGEPTPAVTTEYAEKGVKKHEAEFTIRLQPEKEGEAFARYRPEVEGLKIEEMPEGPEKEAWKALLTPKDPKEKPEEEREFLRPRLITRFGCGPWNPKSANQYELGWELEYDLDIEESRDWKCEPLEIPNLAFDAPTWGDPKWFEEEKKKCPGTIAQLEGIRAGHEASRSALEKLLQEKPPEAGAKEKVRFEAEHEKKILGINQALQESERKFFAPDSLIRCFGLLSNKDREQLRAALRKEAMCLARACVEGLDELRRQPYSLSLFADQEEYLKDPAQFLKDHPYLGYLGRYRAYKERLDHILGIWRTINQAGIIRLDMLVQDLWLKRESKTGKPDPALETQLLAVQTELKDLYLDQGWIALVIQQTTEEAAINASEAYLYGLKDAWERNLKIPLIDVENPWVDSFVWLGQLVMKSFDLLMALGSEVLGYLVDKCKELFGGTTKHKATTEQIEKSRARYVERHNALQVLRGYSPQQLQRLRDDLRTGGKAQEILPALMKDRHFHEQTQGGIYRLAACYASDWKALYEWEYLIALQHAELVLASMKSAVSTKRYGEDITADPNMELVFGIFPVKFDLTSTSLVSDYGTVLSSGLKRFLAPITTIRMIWQNVKIPAELQDTSYLLGYKALWGEAGEKFTGQDQHLQKREVQLGEMRFFLSAWREIQFEDPLSFGVLDPSKADWWPRNLALSLTNPDYMDFLERHGTLRLQQRKRTESKEPAWEHLFAAVTSEQREFGEKYLETLRLGTALKVQSLYQEARLAQRIQDHLMVWEYDAAIALAEKLSLITGIDEATKIEKETALERTTETFLTHVETLGHLFWHMFLVGKIFQAVHHGLAMVGLTTEGAAAAGAAAQNVDWMEAGLTRALNAGEEIRQAQQELQVGFSAR